MQHQKDDKGNPQHFMHSESEDFSEQPAGDGPDGSELGDTKATEKEEYRNGQ